MALLDIHPAEGDAQNFILELPATSFTGALYDISDDGSKQGAGEVTELDTWEALFEGTTTYREAMRIMFAALANKSSGGGTTTVKFRDKADGKDRITATVDANGNRTAITVDGT